MKGLITCLEGTVEIVALPAGSQAESARAGNRGGRKPSAAPTHKPKQRSAKRQEKAQQEAFEALSAVSSYHKLDEDLPVLFVRLSENVTGLVGAHRACFW